MKYTGERNSKGKRHGQGTVTYASGTTYTGEWKDGKRNGHGTYTGAGGGTYTGEWKDDKRQGKRTGEVSQFETP